MMFDASAFWGHNECVCIAVLSEGSRSLSAEQREIHTGHSALNPKREPPEQSQNGPSQLPATTKRLPGQLQTRACCLLGAILSAFPWHLGRLCNKHIIIILGATLALPSTSATMASFTDLPVEILLMIGAYLTDFYSFHGLWALTVTSRRNHHDGQRQSG